MPIKITVNNGEDHYSKENDQSEFDYFQTKYPDLKKMSSRHIGDYTVFYVDDGAVYVSNNKAYPHILKCFTSETDTQDRKFFCVVHDNLFDGRLLNGKSYEVEYQIQSDEIQNSKNISHAIESMFYEFLQGIDIQK